MNRGAWWATVHMVTKSQKQLKPLNMHAGKQKRMYRSLLDSVEEGEGGMIWENGIETCISYMK